MINRSRGRIVADILEAARKEGEGGALSTEIMYGAKLSFTQVKIYIPSIVEGPRMLDIIPVNNRRGAEKAYRINDRGRRYLNDSRFVSEAVEEVEKVMESIKKSKLVKT